MNDGPTAFESTADSFGPAPPPSARTILAGVDGSDTAMRAAAFAFGMARRQGARLVVTFVACRSSLAAFSPAAASVLEHETAAHLHAELSDQIRATAEELDVPVTFVKAFGDSFTTLRDAADRCQADVVVVGASQRAGHRFAGSVANRLIRSGHWPVLVVP
ncbi:Nucleotide-binding universal stress protein, UspA family [Lentzea xinjiangensis]|uniref:Nucleotide-binding universal stress protein, UspA family n=1 Tax=Lentzea xinjiangensis TaxID=402600 RepID=A0A1H9VJG4_9PSEU|nr:universal stress protein [Lentzea xinjiangensis]SES21926.1 Nucleotide-binding universal stress protein, UspA family [Lentzea xinjiangensis]